MNVEDDSERVSQEEKSDNSKEGVGLTILNLHLSSLTIWQGWKTVLDRITDDGKGLFPSTKDYK